MFFISHRTKAKFYNESKMTFLVQKDCVDIIFKIKRGVYLTVSVYSLSEGRLLLSCVWDEFWDRLKNKCESKTILAKLDVFCPLAANIFRNTNGPHFAYLDKTQNNGAIVQEIKAIVQTNCISDYIHESVVQKAIELMEYNLDVYCELEEKCPFEEWKKDLRELYS